MKLRSTLAASAVLVVFLLAGCDSATPSKASRSEQEQQRVLVATASNFVATLEKLEIAFEAATPYELELATGSSGKLYAQILAGAPFDIFLSADVERPQKLARMGLAEAPFTYAEGRLELWAPGRAAGQVVDDPGAFSEILSEQLARTDLRHVAIANPELAPYGRATKEVLSNLEVLNTLSPRLVYGENIGQTHLMIATGNATFGFTASSYLRSTETEVETSTWLVPERLHAPIVQQGVVLVRSSDRLSASAFVDFLATDAARAIVSAGGYGVSL